MSKISQIILQTDSVVSESIFSLANIKIERSLSTGPGK